LENQRAAIFAVDRKRLRDQEAIVGAKFLSAGVP
jgi:hypothetical protein